MELLQQPGWIEVICGSMFSGKSEELIRRVRRTQYAKQNILVFKPEIDDRYSANDVVSHNGTSAFALSINKASEILEKVTSKVDVIAIDEGNFFDEEIVAVAQILADRGHRVIIAGLDQDFRGEPFPQMASLIALAEFVTKFQAICSVCGSPASRTQRIVNGKPADYYDPIILIGATEAYEARCRHHHIVENKPVSNNFDCNEKAPRL